MGTASDGHSSRYNRKSLLGRIGIGAAAAGTGGLVRTDSADAAPAHGQRVYAASAGHFGRIFDRLPPFAPQSPRVEAALRDLGKPGGILDARDALDKGPVLLITDPSLSANNPNNPEQTAGIDVRRPVPRPRHDVRRRLAAGARRPSRGAPSNARTPALRPRLGLRRRPRRLAVALRLRRPGEAPDRERAGSSRTCPRTADGTAIIADPRNDEHVIIAGLQCAFILFHNKAVDAARTDGRRRPVRAGAAADHLALPLADPPRVPAALRRAGDGRQRAEQGPALLPAARRRLHAGRVPGCRLPLRAQHGASVLPREPEGRRRQAVLRARSSTRPPPGPTRSICAAAVARRGASSAGRRSSTSATAR